MSRTGKASIIFVIILAIGIALMTVGWATGGGKSVYYRNGKISVEEWEDSYTDVDEAFEGVETIIVDMEVCDIEIIEGASFRVYGKLRMPQGVEWATQNGGVLKVGMKGAEGYGGFELSFNYKGLDLQEQKEKLTVTCPPGAKLKLIDASTSVGYITFNCVSADSVKGSIDMGNMFVENLNAGSMELETDFGRIDVSGSTAGSAEIELNAGDLNISGFAVSSGLKLSADDAGAIGIEDSSIEGESEIETAIGDITMKRVSFKGECSIEVGTGTLDLDLNMPESEVSYTATVHTGDLVVNGIDEGSSIGRLATNAVASIKLDLGMGSAKIRFA
jgi:hypothetical protein